MTGRANSFKITHIIMIALLSGTGLSYVNVLGQAENEVPSFEGQNPQFTPPPESERTPPPPPSDALTVTELPTPSEVENETDVDPLSVTNRTEILEILPLNSTNIVEFVDEELKNSTGVGLAPSSVLENLTVAENSQAGNLSNTTILDVLGPQEIEEVANMTPTTNQSGELLDLDEVDLATANETDDEGVAEEEIVSPTSTTNETSADDATGGAGTTPEEIVSPASSANETSSDNEANGKAATQDDSEEDQAEEEDETSSSQDTPSVDEESTSTDNNVIDLDGNKTGNLLGENMTALNNTTVLPTDEAGGNAEDEGNDGSGNDGNEESDNEESDGNN
jgi:hypothetical protein